MKIKADVKTNTTFNKFISSSNISTLYMRNVDNNWLNVVLKCLKYNKMHFIEKLIKEYNVHSSIFVSFRYASKQMNSNFANKISKYIYFYKNKNMHTNFF